MSTLILVERPPVRTARNNFLPIAQVVGIIPPNSRTIMEADYRATGREIEEALTLDDQTADKLVSFYTSCYAAAPEDRPPYNCHLLAFYITGAVAQLKYYNSYHSHAEFPADAQALESGVTYAIRDSYGIAQHSLVGINRPDHNLSVVGDYGPLAITKNTDLIQHYNGTKIYRTIPETAG